MLNSELLLKYQLSVFFKLKFWSLKLNISFKYNRRKFTESIICINTRNKMYITVT